MTPVCRAVECLVSVVFSLALAQAADADRWAGTIISARQLADAYGVTDTDGSRPDCWGYLVAYGWEREDGEGIADFR